MARQLLTLENIHLTFGGHPILAGAELSIGHGERLCLVGRNGSGKSTLLKIAAGHIDPDEGTRWVHPGTTVRYLPQEPDLSGFKTVLDYAVDGLDDPTATHRAQYCLERLSMKGDEDPSVLSGGEARRAALARVLAPNPDILMVDEPTNHLDLQAIEWLEQEIAGLGSAIVLISHDRRFLEQLTRSTVWLDRGQARRLDKGFKHFEDWRDTVLEDEARDRHKLDRKIAMEEHWLRHGVSGRRKRNQKRLGALFAMRADRKTYRGPQGKATLEAAESGTSGKRVVEAEEISKSFGERAIVRGFSTRILRGDRVGIIGPNGAGKTTLINLLMGVLEPDSGTIHRGTNLDLVTLDQRRADLRPDTTLQDALTGGGSDQVMVNEKPRHVIGYMKDFLFTPQQARQPIGRLSGGERGRLMLARALASPSNFMVLDEPTNDLDLETLDLLQELLADYDGTVLLVSHDRDFLDRVATSVIVAEGDGRWGEYPGGYSDMLDQRGKRPARDADTDRSVKTTGSNQSKPSKDTSNTKRFGLKEKELLKKLSKQIEDMKAQREKLSGVLSDPEIFTRDPEGAAKMAKALDTTQNALTLAEDRWLELEILREELDG